MFYIMIDYLIKNVGNKNNQTRKGINNCIECGSLISGNHKVTEDVEEFLAGHYKAESALIFNSGYNANIGFFSSLPQRGDTIIYDELIHASIRDGIRLSNANSYSFKHNDLIALEEKINKANGNVWIAEIFSK